MKTEKIGLKAFLHRRDVSDMETPLYNCSQMSETATHLTIEYQKTTEERQKLNTEITMPIHTRYDFDLTLKNLLMTRKVMKWMLKLGHLHQYRLAIHIGGESEELQKMKVETAKKNRKHSATIT